MIQQNLAFALVALLMQLGCATAFGSKTSQSTSERTSQGTSPKQASRKVRRAQKPPEADSNWLVFLPGSECEHYDGDTSRWINEILRVRAFNVLVIEKRGVRDDGSCDLKEFNEHSLRDNRIADIRRVLAKEVPADKDILLIAESEGGYISPDIAVSDKRVKMLVNLSGGTRSWIDEEVSFVPNSKKAALRKFFDREVIGHPDPDLFYRGFSYAELNSYDNHKAYDSLNALAIPVLMFNGDRDGQTWVEGTTEDVQQLLQSGKSNITQWVFPGVSHSLTCFESDARCEDGSLRSTQNRILNEYIRAF